MALAITLSAAYLGSFPSDLRAQSATQFVSASVNGPTLSITFSGPVTCPAGCINGIGFTLLDAVTSTVYAFNYLTNGNETTTLSFLLVNVPPSGHALQLSYRPGVLTDSAGNPIAAFANDPVANGIARTQTITFTGLPATAIYGSAGPYTLSATASSGLPVSYSITGPATRARFTVPSSRPSSQQTRPAR